MAELSLTGSVPGVSLPTTLLSQTGTGWSGLKLGDRVYVAAPGPTTYIGFIDPTTNPGQFLIYPTLSDCYSGTSPLSFSSAGAVTIKLVADFSFSGRYGSTLPQPNETVGTNQLQSVQLHSHSPDQTTGGGDGAGSSQSFSYTLPNQNTIVSFLLYQ